MMMMICCRPSLYLDRYGILYNTLASEPPQIAAYRCQALARGLREGLGFERPRQNRY